MDQDLIEDSNQNVIEIDKQTLSQTQKQKNAFYCSLCSQVCTMKGEHELCSLSCGHSFGRKCIKEYLQKCPSRRKKCPMCNKRANQREIWKIYPNQTFSFDKNIFQKNQKIKLDFQNELKDLDLKIKELENNIEKLTKEKLNLENKEKELDSFLENYRKNKKFEKNNGIFQKFNSPSKWILKPLNNLKSNISFAGNNNNTNMLCTASPWNIRSSQQPSQNFQRNFLCIHDLKSPTKNPYAFFNNFNFIDSRTILSSNIHDFCSYNNSFFVAQQRFQNFGIVQIDQENLESIRFIPLHSCKIEDLKCKNELVLTVSQDKWIKLTSAKSNQQIFGFESDEKIFSCCFDPNSTVFYCGKENGDVSLFDTRNLAKPLTTIHTGFNSPVHSLSCISLNQEQNEENQGILIGTKLGLLFSRKKPDLQFENILLPLTGECSNIKALPNSSLFLTTIHFQNSTQLQVFDLNENYQQNSNIWMKKLDQNSTVLSSHIFLKNNRRLVAISEQNKNLIEIYDIDSNSIFEKIKFPKKKLIDFKNSSIKPLIQNQPNQDMQTFEIQSKLYFSFLSSDLLSIFSN
ncbi:rfwd3 protein [Anaeramoeba ignava]|uniref:RING-type E3 ubiquitin transferase n=1 Tax=Anaeramoeba ignava TaxID=1746090 RepID=A0A9Q0LE03_ANAIG|nr:rfwd3 protein [Anaeramoeba ignava]